ncbi:hypothetical protein K435DRAFT_959761 [Dendrothele bispora CBS 962.96]|uniref:CTLH domain-containing protein n=1 Tax=Dendrothele bispora (strain CBS 962.96) TaxID=1314807 RepID=A0A4V4HIS4_DENBC|nr:hypothetical protein K435DRAFT_959761 [Dendrothele bispora CBS 962.96]
MSLKRPHPADDPELSEDGQSVSHRSSGSTSGSENDTDDESYDSADEIAEMKPQKSRQTKKRKLRATGSTAFGTTLQSLLNTQTSSNLPLSLKPSVTRKLNDEKLEAKAKRVLQIERKEKEDKGRVTDIIGGWGNESERALRKVAQRGVVKLFNMVQQSQNNAAAIEEKKKASRGSGKPTLPAPKLDSEKKKKQKDNIIGRAKDATVEKDEFFDMIRIIIDGLADISLWKPPNSKTVIRKEEWDRRMHEVPLTKADMNRLVMDYLVIEGYKSAAEEFSQEAHVAPPVDFESIEYRMNIREALHRGDVADAIVRVNDLNPEILDTNPKLYFRLQQQKLIELIRQGRTTEAIEFAQEELAPRGEESPEFLGELEKTMSLLAFEASSTTPAEIGELLSPAQRMKTAGEVNAAILESLSQGKEVKLVSLLKLLSWGTSMLSEQAEVPSKLLL